MDTSDHRYLDEHEIGSSARLDRATFSVIDPQRVSRAQAVSAHQHLPRRTVHVDAIALQMHPVARGMPRAQLRLGKEGILADASAAATAESENGPTRSVRLHTFRVDSPMKGAVSSLDETRLSFEVVTLNPSLRTLTVRECLWNPDPAHPLGPGAWGDTVTVSLGPQPTRKTSSPS